MKQPFIRTGRLRIERSIVDGVERVAALDIPGPSDEAEFARYLAEFPDRDWVRFVELNVVPGQDDAEIPCTEDELLTRLDEGDSRPLERRVAAGGREEIGALLLRELRTAEVRRLPNLAGAACRHGPLGEVAEVLMLRLREIVEPDDWATMSGHRAAALAGRILGSGRDEPEAARVLIRVLEEPEDRRRAAALIHEALWGGVGPRSRRVLEEAMEVLVTSDDAERFLLALPAVTEAQRATHAERLRGLVEGRDPALRRAALDTVGTLCFHDSAVADGIAREELGREAPLGWAIDLAGNRPDLFTEDSLAELVEAGLGDESPSRRHDTMRLLSHLGRTRLAPLLATALRDEPDPVLRRVLETYAAYRRPLERSPARKTVFTLRGDRLVALEDDPGCVVPLPIPGSIDQADFVAWLELLTPDDARRLLDQNSDDDLFAEFFPGHVAARLAAVLEALEKGEVPPSTHLRYHRHDPQVRRALLRALERAEGSLSALAHRVYVAELTEAHEILERRHSSLPAEALLETREAQMLAETLLHLDRGVPLALATLVKLARAQKDHDSSWALVDWLQRRPEHLQDPEVVTLLEEQRASRDDGAFVAWFAATGELLRGDEWLRLARILLRSAEPHLRSVASAALWRTVGRRSTMVRDLLRTWVQIEDDEEALLGAAGALWSILPAERVTDIVWQHLGDPAVGVRVSALFTLADLPPALATPIAAAAVADEPDLFLRAMLQKLASDGRLRC